ncbi:MAG: metallophosphoesterase, partial [Omnitrophica WOR_2 bacterium]
MKSSLLTIVILIAFQFSVKAQNSTQNSDTTKVIILSLNDQHAKIDNYGQLKAAVDKIRKENKYVYLFSGGDNFTGNPVVDQYPDKGYPMIDLMNSVGFTASAVGNHEFDYGQQVLGKRMKQANFPFLNANIKDSTGNFKFKPYYIIKLDNGLRIGV